MSRKSGGGWAACCRARCPADTNCSLSASPRAGAEVVASLTARLPVRWAAGPHRAC